MTQDEALTLLTAADIFHDEDDDMPGRWLNLNDTFFWACGDGEEVADDELPELGRLFRAYGMCGVHYWVACKRDWKHDTVEFLDVRRCIQFVAQEETLRSGLPDSSQRAYKRVSYTLGG